MIFSQMTRGDSFGGRTLIPYEIYSQMKLRYMGPTALDKYYPLGCSSEEMEQIKREPAEVYQKKSLLSIMADSA